MADVSLTWNNATGYADWSFTNGDLTTGDDLLTATLFSLFTDLALPSDQTPPDGSTDRRGWWANVYEDRPYGSLLWTLERSKIVGTAAVALQAQQYATSALQWLVDDGVVATLNVQTGWVAPGVLGIIVTMTEPAASTPTKPFQYAFAWTLATQIIQSVVVPDSFGEFTFGATSF